MLNWIPLVALAAALSLSFGAGWYVNGLRMDVQHGEALQAALDAQKAANAKVWALEADLQKARTVARKTNVRVEKEIVEKPVYRDCTVTPAGVSLLNGAIIGATAEPVNPVR